MKNILFAAVRYYKVFTIVGLILFCVGAYYSGKLYQNLRPDLEELLPETARSVQDLYTIRSRLESTDYIAVLVFPKDKEIGKRIVDDLAKRFESRPKNEIARIEYRIDSVLEFFESRKALFLDKEELVDIRNYIDDRIYSEKQKANPIKIFDDDELEEEQDAFNFDALEKKYQSKASQYTGFPEGYFATKDMSVFAIMVYMPSAQQKMDASYELQKVIDAQVAATMSQDWAKGQARIKFTGGIRDLIEEHSSLMKDLGIATATVMILVTALIWIYFASTRAVFALLLSLVTGTVLCFSVTYALIGYLNANSAFLGAIILGNGINFGIIYLARYLEEVRKNRGHYRSIYRAFTRTWKATWVAALSAGLAYGSLVFTEFRGFRQFGTIGLIGMVLCWISAFTLIPAFLTLFERIWPYPKVVKDRPRLFFTQWFTPLVMKNSGFILVLTLLFSIASLGITLSYTDDIIETNMSNLRDKQSETDGSGFHSKFLHKIFRSYPHPNVVLAQDPEEAFVIGEALKKRKGEAKQDDLFDSISTIFDLVPRAQDEKISVLKEIKSLLTPKVMASLTADEKKQVKGLLTPEALSEFKIEDLPAFVKNRVREKDGQIGRLVFVTPPTSGIVQDRVGLMRYVTAVRETVDSVRPGTPVAGQLAVSADMSIAIGRDGPYATLISLVSVMLLIIFIFRRAKAVVPVITSLLLGVFWLVGFVLGMDYKINFLNFIVFPITFGISVDYSVNILQRYFFEGYERIAEVLKQSAGAVAVASATTIIGYGSLLLAGNQAIKSFGTLAVIGEITCLFTAILSLPAFLIYMHNREESSQRLKPQEES